MKGRQARLQEPKMMLQNPKKIQVLNVPEFIPAERMLDKLTIYFQRKSNGGGEVVDVEYPTGVKHCAYITFENEEDANNVLKRDHILQLDEKKYKLEVHEAEKGHSDTDDEQVMLFVSTKLDTRPFDIRKVNQLIARYGLHVVSYENFILEIKGSFPALKKLRSDLMNLIPHQSPHAITDLRHSANNKRLYRDGKSLQSGAFNNYRPQTASDRSSDSSTTSEDDDCSAGEHTRNIRSRSCMSRVRSGKSNSSPLPLISSPSSLPGASSNNIEDTSPYTHRSISGLQGAAGYSGTFDQRKGAFPEMNDRSLNTYSSHSSTGPSASPHLSITVDRLVFAYLEADDKNEFHQILEEYSVDFEKCYFDDLCKIRLHPKRAVVSDHICLSHAEAAVCAHIQKVQKQLRTHQVDLNVMKSCEKQEILSRCRLATDFLEVQLIRTGQTIHLVGPSAESYKALQYVLGNCGFPSATGRTGPCQRARRLDRSESRAKRNSSCPPIKKESPMDNSNANLPAIKHAKQTQAQTGDQQQIPPSPGYAHQRRQSLSEARKTAKDKRSPINSDVQDSQTRAGRSAEAQRVKGDRQPYTPEIRQSLTPNLAMGSHRGNKKGNCGINV